MFRLARQGRCAVPRQQRVVVLDGLGLRQSFEDVAQVGVGFLAVGLGGFHQAVELGAGGRAPGRVAEQPVIAADNERPDGPLGRVVVDR